VHTSVRLAFSVAAVIAVVGGAVFVQASSGSGASIGWTAFFGTYLALSALAAAVAVISHGPPLAVAAGITAGAAIAFHVLSWRRWAPSSSR
jgi:hypothetical protein